jgi:hypothetical protein
MNSFYLSIRSSFSFQLVGTQYEMAKTEKNTNTCENFMEELSILERLGYFH